MAKVLVGAGIKQNDVISIIAENRHEFTSISLGVLCINAIVAPVNLTYTESNKFWIYLVLLSWTWRKIIPNITCFRHYHVVSCLTDYFLLYYIGELKHALELSKPKLVFVSPYAAKKIIAVCRQLNFVKNVIVLEGKSVDSFVISLDDFVKKHRNNNFDLEEFVLRKVNLKEQVASIMCSSGTTGMPKGVMITQWNIISTVLIYREKFALIKTLYEGTRIIVNISPWVSFMIVATW